VLLLTASAGMLAYGLVLRTLFKETWEDLGRLFRRLIPTDALRRMGLRRQGRQVKV
jgi:hypothetical protein